jgi:hypothetical protein
LVKFAITELKADHEGNLQARGCWLENFPITAKDSELEAIQAADLDFGQYSRRPNESWISSCITDQKSYQLPRVSERKRHLGTNFKEY